MKPRTFRYLLGTGCKNVWVNKLMSLASVGVLVACMVIIGSFSLITENLDRAMGDMGKENLIKVFFNDANSVIYGDEENDKILDPSEVTDDMYKVHSEEEAKAVCEEIKKISNVESVTYVSKETALERLKENQLKESATAFDYAASGDSEYSNPLSDGADVKIADITKFEKTLKAIQKVDGVDSTQSNVEIAQKLTAIKNGINMAGFWIVLILVIIALVIVSNTIRVTMYNRKLEISIMKAVGATNSFIRIPFVVEGMLLGVISAVISTGILYFAYKAVIKILRDSLSISNPVPFMDSALMIFLEFVAIGVAAGLIGSVFIISKYLRKEGSEFSAI